MTDIEIPVELPDTAPRPGHLLLFIAHVTVTGNASGWGNLAVRLPTPVPTFRQVKAVEARFMADNPRATSAKVTGWYLLAG